MASSLDGGRAALARAIAPGPNIHAARGHGRHDHAHRLAGAQGPGDVRGHPLHVCARPPRRPTRCRITTPTVSRKASTIPPGRGIATIPYLINTPRRHRDPHHGQRRFAVARRGLARRRLSADRRSRRAGGADRVRAAASLAHAEDRRRTAVLAGRRHHARRHARHQRRAGLRILPAQARRRLDAMHLLRLRRRPTSAPCTSARRPAASRSRRPRSTAWREALQAVIDQTEIRHIYLVGGSLTDARKEGERFLQLARFVKQANKRGIPVALGSGALPDDVIEQFHAEQLVQHVCFNLEMWSEPLFAKVCPGKNRYVGYGRWIEALETAVRLWGRGNVYSAMVAGIELEPEHGLEWEEAARIALQGAEDLCSRGIIPIYSLVWPVGGRTALRLPRPHPQLFRDAELRLPGDPQAPRPDGLRGVHVPSLRVHAARVRRSIAAGSSPHERDTAARVERTRSVIDRPPEHGLLGQPDAAHGEPARRVRLPRRRCQVARRGRCRPAARSAQHRPLPARVRRPGLAREEAGRFANAPRRGGVPGQAQPRLHGQCDPLQRPALCDLGQSRGRPALGQARARGRGLPRRQPGPHAHLRASDARAGARRRAGAGRHPRSAGPARDARRRRRTGNVFRAAHRALSGPHRRSPRAARRRRRRARARRGRRCGRSRRRCETAITTARLRLGQGRRADVGHVPSRDRAGLPRA